ncbi:amidohydrolase family protein [Rhodococcus sp. T2V]|uniref:amidohydrolase family protein n=1 Tax=Rhodococcus sp. T2V TaxID=3034164 RepID=UPI0023E19E6C|nr:amidohydrolase family protein [Rhodococcus sp. T2V]MDF3309851.1 amidohydrolase family protein [Rhodococcus sp. T2V]
MSGSTNIPADAPAICDSHVHVLDPERFPYAGERTYTPAPATVTDLETFMQKTGVGRVVLVQPSVYGTDNAALVDGLGKLGPGVGRGVAVIDTARTSDAELGSLRDHGVRGLRVNVAVHGDDGSALAACIDRAAPFGLAVEIYAGMPFVLAHRGIIESSPVPVVLDHYAGVDPAAGSAAPGLFELTEILRTGHVWLKMSAPYRLPNRPASGDVEALSRHLVRANVDRLLWASDWPHTGRLPNGVARTPDAIDPFHDVDDVSVLAAVRRAAGSDENAYRILVDNPAALFGF